MNFFLAFLVGSGLGEGLVAIILVCMLVYVIGGSFNAVLAFIPGFIVFCIAKAFLEGLTSSVNNRFIASVVPILGGLVLGYLASASVYESEQAKDAEREVQKQQSMTQQDKVYYIKRSLMFGGYGVAIDGKWGKKNYASVTEIFGLVRNLDRRTL